MITKRACGILLHPTSFPSEYGIGELDDHAYKFIDFLKNAGQTLWQIFPLGPTGYGDSPYQSFSAFAGNPLLISLKFLKKKQLLSDQDLEELKKQPQGTIDYGFIVQKKYPILKKAFKKFIKNPSADFKIFKEKNQYWLQDYSLFMSLKQYNNGKVWNQWDDDIKKREKSAIEKYKKLLKEEIEFHNFLQYEFFTQWTNLKKYANENGIKIIGDLPIFVAYDSADVWSNPELFKLDENYNPYVVAGVPPDYFSEDGQRWGNPHYNWELMKKNKFSWWIERFKKLFELVDIIRVDHFRGFEASWEIPAQNNTAREGKWVKAPGYELFNTIKDVFGKIPIIAEDLGFITPEVDKFRKHFGFPGMKILQFAFDKDPENRFLPHNYSKNYIVYTGTHDNDTTLGWYKSLEPEIKQYVKDYILSKSEKTICWDMIRIAYASVANTAIIPLQDILCLDSEARMNFPSTLGNNWKWRYLKNNLNKKTANKLKKLAIIYGRCPQ